jgi:hypothetical protein
MDGLRISRAKDPILGQTWAPENKGILAVQVRSIFGPVRDDPFFDDHQVIPMDQTCSADYYSAYSTTPFQGNLITIIVSLSLSRNGGFSPPMIS